MRLKSYIHKLLRRIFLFNIDKIKKAFESPKLAHLHDMGYNV